MATVTIDGEAFEIPGAEEKGFVEGHACTAAEARTLAQTYKENVGNNLRKLVKAGKEAGKSAADMLSEVVEYATNYTFAVPSAGGGRTVRDPVEREIHSIVRESLKAQLTAEGKGRKLKDIPDEKIDAIIEKNLTNPDIVKEAKRRVAARTKAAGMALEGTEDLAA